MGVIKPSVDQLSVHGSYENLSMVIVQEVAQFYKKSL